MTAAANAPASTLDATESARPRYLRRVDVRSAVLIAAFFNAVLGVAFTLTGWVLILLAAQRGFLDQVNEVTTDLGTGHGSHLSAIRLAILWMVIVGFWVVALTVVVGLAAFVLNHVLEMLGGVELDLRHEPGPKTDVEVVLRRSVASALTRLRSLTQLRREQRPDAV